VLIGLEDKGSLCNDVVNMHTSALSTNVLIFSTASMLLRSFTAPIVLYFTSNKTIPVPENICSIMKVIVDHIQISSTKKS
jgi:hypothetical protein